MAKKLHAGLDEDFPCEIDRQNLLYITNESHLYDRHAIERFMKSAASGEPIRIAEYQPGKKEMDDEEKKYRSSGFFEKSQDEWSSIFFAQALGKGISEEALEDYILFFSRVWTDSAPRQKSATSSRIKASIFNSDLERFKADAGRFCCERPDIKSLYPPQEPLFTPGEIRKIFEINSRLLDVFIGSYLEELSDRFCTSINKLYVGRGVFQDGGDEVMRKERNYLSSYSIFLGPVEQFSQTHTKKTKDNGASVIYSAPLPAVQERVVAFAPFIKGMALDQLELVVAPPVHETFFCRNELISGVRYKSFD
ncbi:hypothetical protein O4G76_06785 [Limimaricola sp. G21655-S1]|uniref:hypothetical protein n=1 Tax=Limimaricola sp. G21655-S1 TaxID=3014768 RepID=UPI0022AE9F2A|nr:hypothetical protein [Limimaricola sp. G21655-S1]MCZ4260547.1 hypothetical protein [Limimaricola sp. G21655-S1]